MTSDHSPKKPHTSVVGGFVARGGMWVLAQIPLLILAYWLPLATRAAAPSFLATIGLIVLIGGMTVSLIALLQLRRALTPFPEPRVDGALRTDGLYAWVRHPVYTGLIVVAAGWALYCYSPWGIATCGALLVFFDRKASREERALSRRYPHYAAYTARVKKLLPGIY